MPIPLLLRVFATRLDATLSDGIHIRVGIHCTDTGTSYGLAVRSEVVDVLEGAPAEATFEMQTTEPTVRGLLTGRITWSSAVDDGAVTLTKGTAEDATRFWSLFDPPIGALPALALR